MKRRSRMATAEGLYVPTFSRKQSDAGPGTAIPGGCTWGEESPGPVFVIRPASSTLREPATSRESRPCRDASVLVAFCDARGVAWGECGSPDGSARRAPVGLPSRPC